MIKKFALKIAMKYLMAKLDDDKFKASIVKAVNRKLDIPKLNEKQEEELFGAILKAIVAYIKAL